jgi:hypothetical protein
MFSLVTLLCFGIFGSGVHNGFITMSVSRKESFYRLDTKKSNTVKLGYNELGYNELPVIASQKKSLVGLGDLTLLFSWL